MEMQRKENVDLQLMIVMKVTKVTVLVLLLKKILYKYCNFLSHFLWQIPWKTMTQ
ncbi:hypothetical protein X975_26283, partial [Stegodyphus mimosarum]